MGLLLGDDGGLDVKAAGAALTARFPDGVRAAEVAAFARGLGGTCHDDDGYGKSRSCGLPGTPLCSDLPHTRLRCEIPVTGGTCSTRNLLILARLHEDGTLSDLDAARSSDGVAW